MHKHLIPICDRIPWSHCVALTSRDLSRKHRLALSFLLPQPLECWNYRHEKAVQLLMRGLGLLKYSRLGASKMAQWVKQLATRPEFHL